MRRRFPFAWALGGALAAGVSQASAQSSGPAPSPSPSPSADSSVFVEAGGKLYVESIRVSATRFSQALRFGAVKKGSETVDLAGRTLARGRDYEVDYPSGTIFLKAAFQEGQILRVSYRYDEGAGSAGVFGLAGTSAQSGFNGFKFDFAPGASAFLSLGLTERTGDGTVLNSNVYGLTNAFSFGPGSLKGIFMLGHRERTESRDNLTGRASGQDVEEGQGTAMIQNLSSKFLGGTVNAYYQDIDTRFGGFQALGGAGYTSEQVAQLSRERGLKRSAFSFDKVQVGDAKISNSFQTVGDSQGTITRRTAGGEWGGLSINWWSQEVDPGFARFQDIGAGDWQQLQKERGLTREGASGKLKLGSDLQMNFSRLKLDAQNGGISRASFGASLPRIKFDFLEQRVDPGFVRFGDVRAEEFNGQQLAQERGMIRRNMGIEAAPAKDQKISLKQQIVRDPQDDFAAMDLSASLGKLSVGHSMRSVGENFRRLPNLGGGDIGSHMSAMLNMTKAGLAPQGNDGGGFFSSAGIDRSLWNGSYDFGKGANIQARQLNIAGKQDSLKATEVAVNTKNTQVRIRSQKTGDNFKEVSRLMASEQAHLGNQAGFNKQDVEVKMNLGGSKKLDVSQMKAGDQGGDASRTSVSFEDKGFSLNMASRKADSSMPSLGTLADPERDLLRSLAGYSTNQMVLRWTSLKGVTVESDRWRWGQIDGDLERQVGRTFLKWTPDSRTSLEALMTEHRFGSPLDTQVNQRNEVFTLARSIDGFGRVTFLQNRQVFDGSQDANPDSLTHGLVVETKLNAKTGLRTEQMRTEFENGEKETKTSNTLSTELTKRAGVSVTQTQVQRAGEGRDEMMRNYGVWYDFGKGIRLNYGYVRGMAGEAGNLDSKVEITPGTVDNVKIDSANYQQVRQDDARDQHIGRVSLSSAKPFTFGWLSDIKFYYNSDTYRDRWAWQRENKNFGLSGAWGSAAFGYDYVSQVAPGGDRAIDRFFSFRSDRTGKSPLQASFRYGVRTLPSDKEVMIRDYSITWKPSDKVSFNHSLVTNALAGQNGVLLGTVATPLRTNSWSLNFEGKADVKAGFFWKENQDESRFLRTREGGINILLRASNPSPIRLTYGLHQTDQGQGRMTAHKFGLSFMQRPGPNQSWNILVENLNWQHGRPSGAMLQNWNVRTDYSWRF